MPDRPTLVIVVTVGKLLKFRLEVEVRDEILCDTRGGRMLRIPSLQHQDVYECWPHVVCRPCRADKI